MLTTIAAANAGHVERHCGVCRRLLWHLNQRECANRNQCREQGTNKQFSRTN